MKMERKEMNKVEDITKIMNNRGFRLEKTTINPDGGATCIFLKEADIERYAEHVILVEVLPTQTWHLFYTQNGMVGFMDSGEFGDIGNDIFFKRVYDLFNKQVNCIRDNLRYD